jgi:hypothetical protein
VIDLNGRRLILVTGSPRSGTTAVGHNLSLPISAGYLHEPFNVTVGIRDVQNHFEVVGARNFSAERLDAIMRGIVTLRLRWKSGVWPTDRGLRRLIKHFLGGRARLSFLRCLANPVLDTIIWKDPLAALLVNEISAGYGIPVVVTARPPEAIAASYVRMGWQPRVNNMLESFRQLGWRDNGLASRFGSEFARPAVAAAALWWLIYSKLTEWGAKNSNIHFASIQDIVDKPVDMYRHLYSLLNIPWSERISRRIQKDYEQSSSIHPGTHLPKVAHIKHRNLDAVNVYGHELLTPADRQLICDMTGTLWTDVQRLCRRTCMDTGSIDTLLVKGTSNRV